MLFNFIKMHMCFFILTFAVVLLFTSTPEAVKAFLRAMLPSLGFVLTSGEEFGRTARVEKAIYVI